MRAIYLPAVSCQVEAELIVDGDAFHHLVNVVRVKANEEILVLNGQGMKARGLVSSISKRGLCLKVLGLTQEPRVPTCDVLLLIPKKDALEAMLKAATELGVNVMYLLRGEYSSERLPDERRVSSILQSAMEQSNNPWLPNVVLCDSWENLNVTGYDSIGVLDVPNATTQKVRMTGQKQLLVVGPEGGFSHEERKHMRSWPQVQFISFPTPILRAPTAMVAGLGWWHGQA